MTGEGTDRVEAVDRGEVVLVPQLDSDVHDAGRLGSVRGVAAPRAGGFHFRWDGSLWRDTRDGGELFAALSRLVSAQSGQPVLLRP